MSLKSLLNLFRGKKTSPIVNKAKRRTVRLQLEALEERINPNTYTWDPTVLNSGRYCASTLDNWDLNGRRSGNHPTALPQSTDTIIFDGDRTTGGVSTDISCLVDTSLNGLVKLQNNYDQTIAINGASVVFTMYGYSEDTLGANTFLNQTSGTGAVLRTPTGSSATFNLGIFNLDGEFDINDGTVNIGQKSGLTNTLLPDGPSITAGGLIKIIGGTLIIGASGATSGYTKITDKGAITVTGNGAGSTGHLNLVDDPTTAGTLITAASTTTGVINVGASTTDANSPILALINPYSSTKQMTIDVPVDIKGNACEMDALAGGVWKFSSKLSGNTMDVFNEHGLTKLGGGSSLEFADAYEDQASSSDPVTYIKDNTTVKLITDTGGISYLNNLTFNSPTGYGTLNLTGKYHLLGLVTMRVDATSGADLIQGMTAASDINIASASIKVRENGAMTQRYVTLLSGGPGTITYNTDAAPWADAPTLPSDCAAAPGLKDTPQTWGVGKKVANASISGFTGDTVLSQMDGSFEFYEVDASDNDSSETYSGGPIWFVEKVGTRWEMIGYDSSGDQWVYYISGTWNADGTDTFTFHSTTYTGSGSHPSSITLTTTF